ncbi:MAG: hypothetical protein R3E79_26585 [Caldilineaceae bacterium]
MLRAGPGADRSAALPGGVDQRDGQLTNGLPVGIGTEGKQTTNEITSKWQEECPPLSRAGHWVWSMARRSAAGCTTPGETEQPGFGMQRAGDWFPVEPSLP